jgi:hypothetical protein
MIFSNPTQATRRLRRSKLRTVKMKKSTNFPRHLFSAALESASLISRERQNDQLGFVLIKITLNVIRSHKKAVLEKGIGVSNKRFG